MRTLTTVTLVAGLIFALVNSSRPTYVAEFQPVQVNDQGDLADIVDGDFISYDAETGATEIVVGEPIRIDG